MGQNCRFLQGPATDPATIAELRRALRDGRAVAVEILNYRKDGTPFWNALSVSPIHDAAGRITHFIGVQTDVTARGQLEEQFRQAQKTEALGRLAGGVAHDFNNLLTIIAGYGVLLLEQLPPEDPGRAMVREMLDAGERASGLTRQLLTFSSKAMIEPRILSLEAGVRALAVHVLAGCGYTVLEAPDGEEALRVARQQPGRIELLVTDVVMPRLGGRELAAQLLALEPRLRVLFLSGYADDAAVRHGVAQGEVGLLAKPFFPSELAHQVRQLLDQPARSSTLISSRRFPGQA